MPRSEQKVNTAVKPYKQTEQVKPAVSSGKCRSLRTPEVIKCKRERLWRNPAHELGFSKSSILRIIQHDRAYKKQKVYGLTEKQKENRVVRRMTASVLWPYRKLR